MGAIVYLTKDELLQYYEDTIVQSGGGMSGIRDLGGLEKTLDFVQNDGYYPEFWCMGYVQDTILLTVTKGFRWWQALISCLRMAEVGRVSIF